MIDEDDAPRKKGALSAFMFFSNATREQVKSENPGMPVTGVARILGEKWKQLSNADREPFNEQAKADKVRATQQRQSTLSRKRRKLLKPEPMLMRVLTSCLSDEVQ
ncbi:hypothetical protein WJX84_004913 [Apatococcus fuscideae]|uniref:HMG box domain-containing protein n=1 Tax=Apatococcus fuscideae TaxID=2026836 RepID=A0AAW1S050_9CHLO